MIDHNLTLLLIEDNDIDVMVVQRLMRRLSIDLPIVRAKDGLEAFELLTAPTEPPRPTPPYVVVMDINMPRMSGFDFLRAMAGNGRFANVPVFILSTSTNARDHREAERYRIREYFVKPITEADLKVVLSSSEADGG